MSRYDDPEDKRIYDIEQIKEWARQDIISELASQKAKKTRRASIINGAVMLSMGIIMLYFLWKFAQSAQIL